MTYNEAYNKIIDAYFKNEIQPLDPKFCFCGTLVDGDSWYWYKGEDFIISGYSREEFGRMEAALFKGMDKVDAGVVCMYQKGYEDVIFSGMCEALEVLKQIHLDRNEIIEPIEFKKRELLQTSQTPNPTCPVDNN